MSLIALSVFSTVWLTVIYIFNCLYARKLIRPDLKILLVYIATMAALGVLGEIVIDTSYNQIFGQPLWEYRVMPIHNAYTSIFSLALWGAVGFHIYLLHNTIQKKSKKSIYFLAGIFCIEAIFFEAIVNLSFMAFFDEFIYYYLPSDLWHITSIQALPFYLFAGFISVSTLRFASQRPRPATIGSIVIALSLVGIGWIIAA